MASPRWLPCWKLRRIPSPALGGTSTGWTVIRSYMGKRSAGETMVLFWGSGDLIEGGVLVSGHQGSIWLGQTLSSLEQ